MAQQTGKNFVLNGVGEAWAKRVVNGKVEAYKLGTLQTMKLSFYAKAGRVLTAPYGTQRNHGQSPARVGRGEGLRATQEPFTCDSDSMEGKEVVRVVRQDGDLWCADQETADFVGTPFVPVTYDEAQGEFVETPAADTSVSTKKGSSK